ncbi:MAG: ATP-binding protein, partial [Candidatus Hydrothermarchaeaceae archaeon]
PAALSPVPKGGPPSRMTEATMIGTVVGTRNTPNTPEVFHFWIPHDEESVAIGSMVKVEADGRRVFGSVEGMMSYSEVEDFLSHQLSRGGDPSAITPSEEQSIVVCKARVLKQDTDRPLRRGSVHYPSKRELREIFNMDGCDIPVGVFANTDGSRIAVRLNEDYLLGYEGAHVNISGMSGLGTKTSSVLFLLSSIFAHSKSRVACVLFNIKSDDLLYLDQPPAKLTKEDLDLYEACGIEPSGFKARFFAPFNAVGNVNSLRRDVEGFRWGYPEIENYIPSLLKAGDQDQKEKLDTAFYDLKKMARDKGIRSLSQILGFMRDELLLEERSWAELVRGSYKATWGKLYNQLKGLESKYTGLVTNYLEEVIELPYDALGDREVMVVDIQQLGFYPRKLVFEKVISEFMKRLEAKSLRVDKLIVFMDELNKYAPSQHNVAVASLKAKLVDISSRGRSIGMVLFGAEQFKSRIAETIIGNVSTDIVGKTKEAELSDPIYRTFSDEVKGKIRRFWKCDKLVDHELFDVPVFVKMPRPPCMLGSDMVKLVEGEVSLK